MSTLHILFEIGFFFIMEIRIFCKLSRMRGNLKFIVPGLSLGPFDSELLIEYVASCRVHCVQEIMAQSIN